MSDRSILRPLAHAYLEAMYSDRILQNRALHRAVNDLRMIRPVVLLDELPWHELNTDGELTLRCADPWLREMESFLRRTLFQLRRFPGDMILRPYLPVRKVVHNTGKGIEVTEHTLSGSDGNHIISHHYHDVLSSDEQLAMLRVPEITYDARETLRRYNLLGELVGDILPVRLEGMPYLNVVTIDDLSRLRGVENLMIDLADRPDFMHRTIRRLTDITLATWARYEELDLLDPDPISLHCTPILTSDLPPREKGRTPSRKNVWGRGAAQIFASVSGRMHEAFDIAYMLETIGTCGLSYYGCCEPLDKKMDIVEKLPNLRKVGMTPWADVDIGAEAIGRKYVLSAKPNPASVAVPRLDEAVLRAELGRIIEACRRNHCSFDLVLKDISTCGHNPENLARWERIAMEMVGG